jgi:signal transduction histidine kinase/DNA-binding response OmpR family regulator
MSIAGAHVATILVVDDTRENRKLVVAVLRGRGHRLLQAANGLEALEVLASEPVDLVITDLVMPVMDGFELVRRMAGDGVSARSRVLFYSASYNVRDAMEIGGPCGVLGIIVKPAEPESILSTVERALEQPLPQPGPPTEDCRHDHIQAIRARAGEALLQKRVAIDRLHLLQHFGAELLAARSVGDAASAFCESAREMTLAVEVAAGVYASGGDPQGVVVRSSPDGAHDRRTGFARADTDPDSVVEGAPARPIATRLGLECADDVDILAIPLDTSSRRHGWVCVKGKVGGGRFSLEDGETLTALVAQTAIACENQYRLEQLAVRAIELQHEVASRQLAEALLRDTEARTRAALQSANVSVWEVEWPSGAVRWWAPPLSLLAFDAVPAPSTYRGLIDLATDDGERVNREFEQAAASRRDFTTEFRGRQPDGAVHWYELKVHVVCDAHGETTTFIGTSADVSDRKTMEGQLICAQRMEAIGQLAGGIAHDFNNLLTAIIGYTELLTKTASDVGVIADLGEIRRAADRAAALTEQLLAFGRQQQLQPSNVDLAAVVDGVAPMLRRLIGDDVELKTSAAGRLRQVRIDDGQFEQVLLNLVLNARDAMPHGGTVSVDMANVDLDDAYCAVHVGAAPGSYVVMTVADTGTGIDPSVLGRIFEPFFTTKPVGKGTGLGLSMVFGIVKQSGGHICARSEPGRGAVFEVYVPTAVVEDVRAGAGAAATVREAPSGGTETVLVAEDEPFVRTFAATVLQGFGYNVLSVSDGNAALELARHSGKPIDLLLTDVVMPGPSGPEVYVQLSAANPGVKVLYMSGYADEAIVRRGFDSGMILLEKPFSADVLARRVREVLDERHSLATPAIDA